MKSLKIIINITIVILLVSSSFLIFKYAESLKLETYNPDGEYKTLHFNIYYPSKYYSENQIKIFSEISERIFERNIQILDIEKEFNKTPYFKISVYLYPTDRMYREAFNCLTLAHYSNDTAFMTLHPNVIDENLTSKLSVGHEYRHILINKFWPNGVHFSFTEALIVYLDEREMHPDSICIYHYIAKEKIESEDIDEFFKDISHPNLILKPTNYKEFIESEFHLFYLSSFIGYLIEHYGIDDMKKLAGMEARENSFKKIYGRNEFELLDEWKNYILNLPKPSKEIEKRLKAYFLIPKNSIIKRYFEFKKKIQDAYFSSNYPETKKLLINYFFFSRVNGLPFRRYSSWLSVTDSHLNSPTKILLNIIFYPFYFFHYCPYRLILFFSLLGIILLLLVGKKIKKQYI